MCSALGKWYGKTRTIASNLPSNESIFCAEHTVTSNKTLVEKTVDLNDRDFLVRNLFKVSYWTHCYIYIITAFYYYLNAILRPFSDYYHV